MAGLGDGERRAAFRLGGRSPVEGSGGLGFQ